MFVTVERGTLKINTKIPNKQDKYCPFKISDDMQKNLSQANKCYLKF